MSASKGYPIKCKNPNWCAHEIFVTPEDFERGSVECDVCHWTSDVRDDPIELEPKAFPD